METKAIHAAAAQCGVVPEALDEVTRQVQAHFGDSKPRPADVDAYIRSLPTWDKIGMAKEEFDGMPVEWRMIQGRSFQRPPAQKQRPYRPHAPPKVLKQWQDLPITEQMAKYRAWCDEQQRP